MNIEINWLAVVFATCAGMVVAGTWYSKAFGKQWRKLTNVTTPDSKRAGNTPLVLTLLANFTTACLLAAAISVFAAQLDSSMIMTSLLVGFFSWLGFSATTLLTHNAFELKNPKLTFINSGYQLTLFLFMALVIGLFGA